MLEATHILNNAPRDVVTLASPSVYSSFVPSPDVVSEFAVGGNAMRSFQFGDQAMRNAQTAIALGNQGVAFGLDATLPGAQGVGVARVLNAPTGETFLVGANAGQFYGSSLGPRALVAPAAQGMMFPGVGPAASAPMAQQGQVALANMLAQPLAHKTRTSF